MKTGTREELIRAINTVLAGELYVSPPIALRALFTRWSTTRQRM
jgi:DNA-binding NarL/FixJ family response regulator